jgi:hypothetical protein
MTQPLSILRKLISSSHSLNLHGCTAHRHDHLDSSRANEETAFCVKVFIFSASFNIQTALQVATVHLNVLDLLLSAATLTYSEQYHYLLLNLLLSYHFHPI